jgi:hypothetical protein
MGIKVWRLEEIPEDSERLPAGYLSLEDAAKWLGVTTEA